MANTKISELTAITGSSITPSTDVLPIVSGATTKKVSVADLTAAQTVETSYPTTDATKAGHRFWFRGTEWHYLTQELINGLGWSGSVGIGFPAPVDLSPNIQNYYHIVSSSEGTFAYDELAYVVTDTIFEVDMLGLGNPIFYRRLPNLSVENPPPVRVNSARPTVSNIRNGQLLHSLEDYGTATTFTMTALTASGEIINQFLTDLPTTTKTVTLKFTNCFTGSTAINATVATNKGYTVVT